MTNFKKFFYKVFNKKRYQELKSLEKRTIVLEYYKTKILDKIIRYKKIIDSKKEINFLHSGHLGDIVYSFPLIKELSKNHTCNFYININKKMPVRYDNHPSGQVYLDKRIAGLFLPLVKSQKFINDAQIYENQKIDINLDLFREVPIDIKFHSTRWYMHLTGVSIDMSEPYLNVESHQHIKNNILIVRSPRYRNDFINYNFLNLDLLKRSLIHKSFDNQNNNEKLEFLGDRVLGLIISKKLLETYPEEKEGIIDKKYANLVNKKTCLNIAKKINIKKFMILGSSHKFLEKSEDKIISDCLEALIGAIFLDSNIDITDKCIMEWFNPLIRDALSRKNKKDSKTRLQEWLQKRGHAPPIYTLSSTEGSPHSKIFFIECVLDEFEITGRDKASSRKAAEQLVASKILKELGI